MEPLDSLWNALSSYFAVPFLAFAVVIGYLIFFIFYYRTSHWSTLDWAERVLFGFLVGFAVMLFFGAIGFPLFFLLQGFYAENLFSIIFYGMPVFFLLVLVYLRLRLSFPLSSSPSSDYFLKSLRNHRFQWPWLLVVFSIVISAGLGWANPFFSSTSRVWITAIFWFDFEIFVIFGFATWLVVQLSCIPSNLSLSCVCQLPSDVIKFCFFPPRQNLRKAFSKMRTKKGKLSRISNILGNDLLHKILIVLLLSIAVVLADSSFHIFSPSIRLVETKGDNSIYVSTYFGSRMQYTISVEKTYRISPTLFPLRGLNLSISNPSNFSSYDSNNYVPLENQLKVMNIKFDSAIQYTFSKDSNGKIISIELMPTNGSSTNQSYLKLSYNDVLSSSSNFV